MTALSAPHDVQADDYPLGRSEAETQRLVLQHQIYGPLTRQWSRPVSRGT